MCIFLSNAEFVVLINVGQDEDYEAVEKKALALGAERMCNAIYEDRYLLGTSLARPCIARAQVRAAKKYNCSILSHGCTGKGNDQGRKDLLDFAKENNIPVSLTHKAPWSMDENLVHTSYESGILERVEQAPPKELWMRTVDPIDAPNTPTEFSLTFEKGIPVKLKIAGETITGSLSIFKKLNDIGRDNGVGRVDLVESRFISLKSRGCYDTPGLTIARLAHIDLEGLVLNSKVRTLRDRNVTTEWSQCLYDSMYFSPEREFLENSVIYSQKDVNGTIKLMAYKGNTYVTGRFSESSNLYSETEASMDSLEGFSPEATSGFLTIQAIRLEKYGAAKIKAGEPLVGP
ncbi:hypothetical protein MY1884_001736 [Beauveria asiatica]